MADALVKREDDAPVPVSGPRSADHLCGLRHGMSAEESASDSSGLPLGDGLWRAGNSIALRRKASGTQRRGAAVLQGEWPIRTEKDYD
jgi:hypothetical protein